MGKLIRLACRTCDVDTFDGIEEIPDGWTEVEEVQSLEQSRAPGTFESKGTSCFEWYTHLGTCPDCQPAE